MCYGRLIIANFNNTFIKRSCFVLDVFRTVLKTYGQGHFKIGSLVRKKGGQGVGSVHSSVSDCLTYEVVNCH